MDATTLMEAPWPLPAGPVLMLEPAGVVHTALEWVPVGAGVPDAYEEVLLCTPDGAWHKAYWDGDEWRHASNDVVIPWPVRWARVEVPA